MWTKKKTKLKCWVLTEEKLDEINARLEYSHQKSLKMPCTGDQNLKFQISSFKCQVCSVSKKEFNMRIWIFYRCARIVYVITGTISGICCNLCGFCLWSVSLLACRLHGTLSQREKKLTQVLCLFCWTGWTFSGNLSKNLLVLLAYLQKHFVAWNGCLRLNIVLKHMYLL